jgi:hypothetical protein
MKSVSITSSLFAKNYATFPSFLNQSSDTTEHRPDYLQTQKGYAYSQIAPTGIAA